MLKEISKAFDVLVLSIATSPFDNERLCKMEESLKQQLIYEGPSHTLLRVISSLLGWPSDFNHVLIKSRLFYKKASALISVSDITCIEFPYLAKYIDKSNEGGGKNLILYNAHNVEYELMLKNKNIKFKKYVLSKIYKIEKMACEVSDFILTTSNRDKELIKKLYNISDRKIFVVPNGVSMDYSGSISFEEKKKFKEKFKLRNAILFIGSSYGPNNDAVISIYDMAKSMPQYDFVIVGGCCSSLRNANRLNNLKLLGTITDQDKRDAIKAADIAINPILRGSGTNLKMLEYLAAGLPTISTPEGNRGLNLIHLDGAIISDIEDFPLWIEKLFTDKVLYEQLSLRGGDISKNFDWALIAERMVHIINEFNVA